MELLHYLTIIRKWFWLIVLATTLAAGSSLIASRLAVPVYRTTTTLMVSQVIESANPNSNDIFASQQLAQTYVQLVTKEPVLSGAVQALGLNRDWRSLRGQVSASPIQGTQLLGISVIDTSPVRAKAVADELARQLILQSPTTPSQEEQDRIAFIQGQLPELRDRIDRARETIADLDRVIAAARSAQEIEAAQNQQQVLNTQMNQWQATYAQLVAASRSGRLNYITIIEPADVPVVPISPKPMLNLGLAVAIGLALSVGAVLLLEYLDDSIRSPAEIRTLLGAPVLTAIGRIEGDSYATKLVAENQPRSPLTEAYRGLRTSLQFSSLDKPLKTLVTTSAGPSEGKSLTAANLAVVLAQAGLSVLLVDADLRRPVQHKIFNLKNNVGLTTWLVGQPVEALVAAGGTRTEPIMTARSALEAFVQNTSVPRLRVCTSGSLPPNPAEVLGSSRMRQFVDEVTQAFDIVILDSPPCVTVTDAVVLSQWADGVLVVLDQKVTSRQAIQRARENLQAAGARILGAVINRLDARGASGYYYSAYYSYYYYNAEGGTSGNGKAPSGLRKLLGGGKSAKPKARPSDS